jgi:dUTP pyrophosphatase
MKYITPDVPNITITDYNGIRNMIDFVYDAEIINLSTGSIIMFELPILDSDIQLNMDEYNIRLSWDMVNLDGVHIENKVDVYSGMKLIRKITSVSNDNTPTYQFIFYNGEDDISDIVNRFIGELNENNNAMKLRIKYFDGATKLKKITKGNWIDVYSREDVFVPSGEQRLIPLGFALELPQGWEGHLAPRSSTFKTWGVIQTNHVGVVDDSYIGDNDEWMMPVYCLNGKDTILKSDNSNYEEYIQKYINTKEFGVLALPSDWKIEFVKGTWIRKGDKIGQFRIMETMPELEFEEVKFFGNKDRKGFGTTGSK